MSAAENLNVAIFLQARGAIAQLFLIYAIICTIPLALGAYLLLSPRRGGNFLNDAFAIFPHVEPGDRLKKLAYRGLGSALILVSAFYNSPDLSEHCLATGSFLPKYEVMPRCDPSGCVLSC